jgi:DNA processing protein
LLDKYKTLDNIITNINKYNFTLKPRYQALEEYQKTIDFGASFILYCDQLYPKLLSQINDNPPLLTFQGNIDLLKKPTVAIVGPRNASYSAINNTKKFASTLGSNGITIVSGMARGVDTVAAQSSLITGTVAVLSSGINIIYPKENNKLYQDIIKYGLIITESPYDLEPKSHNFIQRNRIISGLSLATIVIEAGLQSGSLVTARFASEQNREVFALPGSIADPRYCGTNHLIKEGANIATSPNDVLQNIGIDIKYSISPPVALKYDGDNDICQKILDYLGVESILLEDLLNFLNVSPEIFNSSIVELEMQNKVKIDYNRIAKIMP